MKLRSTTARHTDRLARRLRARPRPGKLPAARQAALPKLLSADIGSKRWIYQQYDHQVRTNTVAPGARQAVVRIKEIGTGDIARRQRRYA